MADYTFDAALVADPVTFKRAASSAITVYAVTDTAEATPLALKALNGSPLANPITSTNEAIIPPFVATVDAVKLVGGGLSVPHFSPTGLRDAAAASATSAATSALQAEIAATAPTDAAVAVAVDAKLPPAITDALANNPTVVTSAANMAQSTAGLIPAWKASTVYTAGQRVIAPTGDVVAAKAAFTSAATYSAANWSASTQDGRIGTIEKTAVFNGDGRLLGAEGVDEILFAVLGNNDKRTVLEIGADGDLTPYAAGRVSGSLGIFDTPLDSGEKFAVVDKFDRVLLSDIPAAAKEDNAYPSTDWAHWGDSMTDDAVLGADAWVTKLSALTGKSHYNGGWYQQTSNQIAARAGGLPALVTLAGNATAATGPSTISAIANKPVLVSGTRFVRGTLAGIPGVIREQTAGALQFLADSPGAYPVPASTKFLPTDATANAGRTVTIWPGRNDVPLQTDIQTVVAAVRATIDYLTPRVKRVILMEVVPAKFDTQALKDYTAQLNAAYQAAFPAYFLKIATWLRTQAAADAAGITFTAQDNTDISNGITPESFRLPGDSTHINAAGCIAVAYRVHLEAKNRGWLI